MSQRSSLMGLLVAATLALTATGTQAQWRYRLQELSYEGGLGPMDFFSPHAINNHGQVVGYLQQRIEDEGSQFIDTALISRGTRLEPLPGSHAFSQSQASGINDRGQVIGEFRLPEATGQTPYLYTDGKYRDLRVEGKNNWDYARGINAQGHVVGRANGTAFIFDGTRSRYIDISGAVASHAEAINDQGTVVGNVFFNAPGDGYEERAFVHDGEGVRFLQNPLLNSQAPQMVDINNAGQMVAHVFDPDDRVSRSFFYGADGRFTDMGSLTGSSERTVVHALNDLGWAVGEARGDTCHDFGCDNAFLWRDGRLQSLNDLLSPEQAREWVLIDAVDINERGQIVGTGSRLGIYSTFVLTPVPEPQNWALLLAGLGVVGMLARRRA